MAITFIGTNTNTSGTGTSSSLALTLPAHNTDDFGIITMHSDEATTVAVHSVTVATGWTQLYTSNDTSGRDRVVSVYYKVFTSGSETNPTATASFADQFTATVSVFRGVHTTTPIDVTHQTNSGQNNTLPTNPAITPVTNNGMLFLVHFSTHNDITVAGVPATPTGMVLGANVIMPGQNHNIVITAYKLDYGSAATITPTAWTHTSAPTGTAEWSVATIAIRPAVATNQYDQSEFRIRNDDGNETTATWRGGEGEFPSVPFDTNFRVRFGITEVGGIADAAQLFRLRYRKDSGSWTDVTTSSSNIKIVSSANFTDGDDTTRQITTGGTYVTNNNAMVDTSGDTGSMNFGASNKTEAEFSLQLIEADLVCPWFVELRVEEVTGGAFAAYTKIPRFGGTFVDIPTEFDMTTSTSFFRAIKGTATTGTKVQGNVRITQDATTLDTSTTTGDNGVELNFNGTPSAINMTDEIFVFSVGFNAPNRIQLATKANNGIVFWLHTNSTNHRRWQIGGNDTDIARVPGHRVWVIDPTSTTDMTETGTFSLTSILYWSWSVRELDLGSVGSHFSFAGRATRIGTSKTATNIPRFYGGCSTLKDLYSTVIGADYSTVNHNYVSKIGDNYQYYCPFAIGKATEATNFDDEGVSLFSPPDLQGDPPTKLSTDAMRVYFDLQTGDTADLSGSYNWGTRAPWDIDSAETITFAGASFTGMGTMAMGAGVTGNGNFSSVDVVTLNASGDLDGSNFDTPFGNHLLSIG